MKLMVAEFTNIFVFTGKSCDEMLFEYEGEYTGAIFNPLMNPVVVKNLKGKETDCRISTIGLQSFIETRYIVYKPKDDLFSGIYDDAFVHQEVIQEDHEKMLKCQSEVEDYLKVMKFKKKQANIPSYFGWTSVSYPANLNMEFHPSTHVHLQFNPSELPRSRHRETAIDAQTIRFALAHSIPFTPLIHEELFLDALNAFYQKDWRKCILYCAISAETIINTFGELAYENAKISLDSRFNLETIKTKDGTHYKDPIFESLMNRSFQEKARVIPLYISGRSILNDSPILLSGLNKLYTSRNKIAHLGAVPDESDRYIPLNQSGALESLNLLREFCKYLGFDDNYFIPDSYGAW